MEQVLTIRRDVGGETQGLQLPKVNSLFTGCLVGASGGGVEGHKGTWDIAHYQHRIVQYFTDRYGSAIVYKTTKYQLWVYLFYSL